MTDFAAQRLAEAKGAAATRAAMLPAFVAMAAAMHSDFTLSVDTADQLAAVLLAIGGHNDLDVDAAAAKLGPLVVEAMRITIRHYTGGPSIDIDIPHYNGQRLLHLHTGNSGAKLTAEHRIMVADQFIDAGRDLGADMISVTQTDQPNGADPLFGRAGDNPRTIALWWD